MRRFTLKLSQEVQEQISQQVEYIAKDSIANTIRWESRLRQTFRRIADMPGHSMDETMSADVGRPLRRVVFENTYILHYHVDDENGIVEMVNFRHGAREPGLGG